MMAPNRLTLSSLPNELLELIVKEILGTRNVKCLSLASRKLRPVCQALLFRVLDLGGLKREMVTELKRALRILTTNPALIQLVRCVRLVPCGRDCKWLFEDSTFTTIMQRLGTSSHPPDTLEITPENYREAFFKDHALSIKTLTQSFFSTSLTTLVVKRCWNVPLALFLVSPNLRKVDLEDTALSGDNPDNDAFPRPVKKKKACAQPQGNEAWYSRTIPSLFELRCEESSQLVAAFVDPPSEAPKGVVGWSELRILSLEVSPVKKSEWAAIQRILDLTQKSLTHLEITPSTYRLQRGDVAVPLSSTLTIDHITTLRTLSLPVIIDARDPKCGRRVEDLSELLATLPIPTRLSSLEITFIIRTHAYETSEEALEAFLVQDWVCLGQELRRLAKGRRLSVLFQPYWAGIMAHERWAEIRNRLTEKLAFLADLPEIAWEIEVGVFCY